MNIRFFTTILLLVGCSNNPKELMSNYELDFPKSEELAQVAQYNGFELNQPTSFVVKDSLLFVMDEETDHFGKCFNINTGEQLSKFALKGRANNEMISIGDISLYGNDSLNISGVYSPEIVKTYCIDKITNSDSKVSSINLPDSIYGSSLIKISTDNIFGTGHSGKSRNKYFFITADKFTTFGEYDKNLFECNKELNDDIMSWHSRFTKHPSKNKVAVACKFGLLFEVVNLDNKKINSKYYEKIKMQSFEMGNSTATGYNGLINCTEISSNEDNIIAVRSEKTSKEDEHYKKWKYNYELLLFDWDLNPIKKYKIPYTKSVQHISQDGKYLYLLTTDNEESYSLLKYKI